MGETMSRRDEKGATLLLELLQLGEDDESLSRFRARLPARSLALSELRAVRRAVLLLAEGLEGGVAARASLQTAAELLQSSTTSIWPESEASPESTTVPTIGDGSIEASTEAIRPAAALARHVLEVDGRRMTLPEYAALCATCGAFPDRVRETHAKFGVSNDAARRRLDEAWQRCFAEHGDLEELWRALRAQFRSWLVQYGQL
jgi:hypothetical protein